MREDQVRRDGVLGGERKSQKGRESKHSGEEDTRAEGLAKMGILSLGPKAIF